MSGEEKSSMHIETEQRPWSIHPNSAVSSIQPDTPIIHRAVPHYPSRLLRVHNHPGVFFVARVPCVYSVFIGLALGILGVYIANFHTSKTPR